MKKTIYETAVGLSMLGCIVIPIVVTTGDPNMGKRPLVRWKQYADKPPDSMTLRRWFLNTDHNLAIVCGICSDLVVVDCDDWEAVTWARNHLPQTGVMVRTGGGGVHFYYRLNGQVIGNRVGIAGMKLDLRGNHGFVIVAPSLHHSGQHYQWIKQDWDNIPVFDPAWIPTSTRTQAVIETAGQSLDFVRERARRYIATIHSVSGSGTGDKNLFRAACVLIQRFELPREVAFCELDAWNHTNAEPPWPTKRLLYKLDQAEKLKQRALNTNNQPLIPPNKV